jgi:hypothetical protein
VREQIKSEEEKAPNPVRSDGKEDDSLPNGPSYRPDAWHRVPLRTAEHVRAFQARVIRQAVQGRINSGDCYKYCYASNLLLKSIEVSELERRLTALEASVPRKGGG